MKMILIFAAVCLLLLLLFLLFTPKRIPSDSLQDSKVPLEAVSKVYHSPNVILADRYNLGTISFVSLKNSTALEVPIYLGYKQDDKDAFLSIQSKHKEIVDFVKDFLSKMEMDKLNDSKYKEKINIDMVNAINSIIRGDKPIIVIYSVYFGDFSAKQNQ